MEKLKPLLPLYNEESQKTAFPQAKTVSKYPDLQSLKAKEAKFMSPNLFGHYFQFMEI